MKKLIAMMMLAVMMVGCQKGDKIESAFTEYAETENIPNFNGVVSIECTDTLDFVKTAPISVLEHQADSVKALLRAKMTEMTDFYGDLNYSKKQQLATEFARIGAECGELWVNDTHDIHGNHALNKLKDAMEALSPYKEPLYFYHIIAKVGSNDISYYGFVCGEDISFVKADDLSDAMRKNDKLVQFQEAMMNVVRTDFVPYSVLIDDIDKLMGK